MDCGDPWARGLHPAQPFDLLARKFLVPSQEKIQEQTRHKSRVVQVGEFVKVRIYSHGVRVSELKGELCAQGLGFNLLLIVVN